MNNLQEAIKRYKIIKEKYPQSVFAKKSLQQLGLVYYNSGDLENSLQYFKRVVNEYPGSPESDEALAGIRNIYVDKGDVQGYYAYTKSLGNYVKIEVNEEDSLGYVSAEKLYMAGNCAGAIKNFERYLTQFPDGKYALHAHSYKADCLYRDGKKEEAYADYKAVIMKGKSEFSEDALIKSASYLYNINNYQEALPYYKRLAIEAEENENKILGQIGEMRCLNALNMYFEAIIAAKKVEDISKIEPEIIREAQFIQATSYRNQQQFDLASEKYRELAKNVNSAIGAESKYWVSQLLFDNKQYDQSEKEIFDFAKKGTSHQYWLARSFVLLSDIFVVRKDNFQAKQYLESVKENYKGTDDGIQTMVTERLERLNTPQPKPKPRANFTID